MKKYQIDWVQGSSPLTRGKHGAALPEWVLEWLIPAHAGKTAWVQVVVVISSAHPRSRGENTASFFGSADTLAHPRSRGENLVIWRMSTRECGSSPLTRGKRPHRPHGQLPAGLIPAHAGKTS